MKKYIITLILFSCFIVVKAQQLSEFNNKPAYVDSKFKELIELEKSQYNTMTNAKGVFKAEAGFFLNARSSTVKIEKKPEVVFIVKVEPGTDPTSVFDLVQFEVRGDKRVFITSKASVGKSSNSFEKINYDVKKIKEGYYNLIVKNLNEGEYFFASNDFMFAFSIN